MYKGKEPQKDGKRGEIAFRIKPHTQEMLRGLKQTLCAPGPRDFTETETELCLSIFSGGRSTIELPELT